MLHLEVYEVTTGLFKELCDGGDG